jgi:hypothetical protein
MKTCDADCARFYTWNVVRAALFFRRSGVLFGSVCPDGTGQNIDVHRAQRIDPAE